MKRTLTDAERIASIREVREAACGDWHEATALWSVRADIDWLLERAARTAVPEIDGLRRFASNHLNERQYRTFSRVLSVYEAAATAPQEPE